MQHPVTALGVAVPFRPLLVLTAGLLFAPAASADPTLTLPSDLVAEATDPSGARVSYTASAVDGRRPVDLACVPGGTARGTLSVAPTFPLGVTPVTCTAGDLDDDDDDDRVSGSFRVTVRDTTPPALTAPAPLTLTATEAGGVLASHPEVQRFLASAHATDRADRSVSVTSNAPALFPVGETVVTFTAQDDARNQATATSRVAVLAPAAQPVRLLLVAPAAGAVVRKPPVLRWVPAADATYYNVQLYRGPRKVLSTWPARARLALRPRWTYGGRVHRLRPGRYTWFVWPGFGARSERRYGDILGRSSFVVRAR
jgi:HYR domain-containing protein